jgi:hypothetical protein
MHCIAKVRRRWKTAARKGRLRGGEENPRWNDATEMDASREEKSRGDGSRTTEMRCKLGEDPPNLSSFIFYEYLYIHEEEQKQKNLAPHISDTPK